MNNDPAVINLAYLCNKKLQGNCLLNLHSMTSYNLYYCICSLLKQNSRKKFTYTTGDIHMETGLDS